MKSESEFKKWLCNALRKDIHITTIETTTSRGVPDIHMCHQGADCFVELKLFTGGRVLLRPEQYAWGTKRAHHGGRSAVLALHPNDRIHIFSFPMDVTPYGKYVSVNSLHASIHVDNVDQLKFILFT